MNRKLKERRNFLKGCAHTALFGSGAAAVTGKMNLIGSALAAQGDYVGLTDYKALVCVFLYGGSDSFNLYIPGEQTLFDQYQTARGALALDQSSLLTDASGNLRFNPNLAEEQVQKSWSSVPTGVVGAGWGGRMADLLMEANSGTTLPPCYSMNSSNFFLPGNLSSPIAVNERHGPELMAYLDSNNSLSSAARNETMQRLLDVPTSHRLEAFARDSFIKSRDSSRALGGIVDASPDFGPVDTDNRLDLQLRMVANLISGREQLGMRRQIFFCGLGGWDTHDNQTPRLDNLSQRLNAAFANFNSAMGQLGLSKQVSTFTISDFGRSLTINGDGSDHGVNGGKLYGDWPAYEVGGAEDVGDKGRVIPTMSLNQYGAALGSWMGLSNSDLLEVFPDLNNFDSDWQNHMGLFS